MRVFDTTQPGKFSIARSCSIAAFAMLLLASITEVGSDTIAQAQEREKAAELEVSEATRDSTSSKKNLIGPFQFPATRITGKVLTADRKPACSVTIRVLGRPASEMDAIFESDEQGRFDFTLRIATDFLPGVPITFTSDDGSQLCFYRFTLTDGTVDHRGVVVQLQNTRTVRAIVVNEHDMPVADANVVLAFDEHATYKSDRVQTDKAGIAVITIPEKERIETAVAWKDQLGLDYKLYSLGRNKRRREVEVAPEFPVDGIEKLVLTGTVPLKAKVVDTLNRPIQGVRLYPWCLTKDSENGNLNIGLFMSMLMETTDENGEAVFAWMPKWQARKFKVFTVWPQSVGFQRGEREYDPALGNGLVMFKLNRLVSVKGTVADQNGNQVKDVIISATGRGYDSGFAGVAKTDVDGRYELMLAPNQIYLVVVQDTKWVAGPQTGFAVFPNKPLKGKDFQVREPTIVHGTLLNEKTLEPIINERVNVYQYGTSLEDLDEIELPNPSNVQKNILPIADYSVITNMAGQFEFRLGDGRFDIHPSQSGGIPVAKKKFEIAGQNELNRDVKMKVRLEEKRD